MALFSCNNPVFVTAGLKKDLGMDQPRLPLAGGEEEPLPVVREEALRDVLGPLKASRDVELSARTGEGIEAFLEYIVRAGMEVRVAQEEKRANRASFGGLFGRK